MKTKKPANQVAPSLRISSDRFSGISCAPQNREALIVAGSESFTDKGFGVNQAFAFAPVVRGSNRLEVRNSGDDHEIVLLGTIGKSWWDDSGVSEKEFRDALDSIPKGKKVTIRVNSEGGSVKEGLGIYNAIKDRSSDITCRIDGYALSIASVFPLAASKVISPKSAIWMIHCAWSWAQGNAADMESAAKMLKEHDKALAEIYVSETGKTLKEVEDAMAAETWIRGSQAVEFGLADETDSEDKENASACHRPIHSEFLKRCKNLSPEILNAISAPKPSKQEEQKETKPAEASGANKKDSMKNAIIATLKKHGIEASETETEEQLQAKLDAKLVEASKKLGDTDDAKGAAIMAQIEKYETRRIEDKVRSYVLANKITNAEVPIFVTAMRNDEEGTTKILDAKEAALPGGEPINYNRVQVVDGVDFGTLRGDKSPELVNIWKQHKTPKARKSAMVSDWENIYAAACQKDLRGGREVLAANTYSATLVTSFLMDGSLTDLQNIWAPLGAFSIDFSPDPYKPLSTGVLKHVTAGSSVQTNATNWESGNSTVDVRSVTMAQKSISFQVSNSDLNSGLRMQDLVQINTANFANAVIDVFTTPIVAATFTATPLISAAAAFGFSDLATLQGQLKKSPIKNVILDGDYIARIANTPGFFQSAGNVGGSDTAWSAFGWNRIVQNTRWDGAGANIKGFACNPQAIVGIAGLPLNPPSIPGGIFAASTMVVPGLNASVQTSSWFNPATRTMWSGLDIMVGATVGDATAGIIIASGNPG